MTLATKMLHALMPRNRVGAMQAIAMQMFRDSTVKLIDDLIDFIRAIKDDLGAIGGTEMREDAIIAWERQFGLTPAASDTLQNRRDAIEAAWALTGFCGPGYIESALNRAGFDVKVVENIPAINLPIGTVIEFANHGTALQFANHGGATQKVFGEGLGGFILGNGYLLQNDGTLDDPFETPVATSTPTGTYFATHGGSTQNYFSTFGTSQFGAAATAWSYVFIIEGSDGNIAEIPTQRKAAFEREVLRLKPAHLGIFMRVRYV